MKKKFSILLLTACLTAGLTGCGTKDDVKVISKDSPTNKADSSGEQGKKEEENTGNANNDFSTNSNSLGEGQEHTVEPEETSTSEQSDNKSSQTNLTGYIFQTEGVSGMVSMSVDMDAAPVIQSLGEADSYFEAPSCAFQGIDKIYTYSHFEIDTYPDGDTDRISMILFLDDLVSTSEGICIGMTKEDMEKAYGTDYEVSNGFYRYTKDKMKLAFIIKDGEISSIEYDSLVLNEG